MDRTPRLPNCDSAPRWIKPRRYSDLSLCNRPGGSRSVHGDEGRALAEACAILVDDGIPMATLSRSLGRGHTWVHWLLNSHYLQPEPRPTQSTSRRSRPPIRHDLAET